MLCWNVYYGNCNSKEIEVFNIFEHYSFYKDCVKAKKKFKDDKNRFAEEVRGSLMYYFWSKCEWEIILCHWPDGEMGDMRTTMKLKDAIKALQPKNMIVRVGALEKDVTMRVYPEWNKYSEEKIDVYQQVMNNWDIFINYLWENRKELKERKL